MTTKRIRNCLIAVAAFLPVSSAFADGGTIQVAMSSDIRSTNPGVDRSGSTDAVHLHVVEGLVGYRDDLSIGPVLAESYVISDDGLTYTFDLREDVTFHNGAPMTSADVLWSWTRYMSEATNWRCRTRFNGKDGAINVVSVETPDADTVVFTIDAPSPIFLKEMARFDCGSAGILHRDSVNADGSWNKPIATGPFKFVEWIPGQRVVLEKFEDYTSGEGPKNGYTGRREVLVEHIVWHVITDTASAKAAMRAGEIDLMRVWPSDVQEMTDAGFGIEFEMTPAWSAFLISRHDAFMQNQALRRAMVHALDMPTLAGVMGFEGHNASPIPPVSTFYSDTQAKAYSYDPEKVKTLLKEAGYKGEVIKVLTNRNVSMHYDQAVIAQSMWQKAGINVELEVLEWGGQLDLYRSGKYQMMSFSFSPRLDPALSWDMFSGTHARKVWNDPVALGLIAQLKTETDETVRQELADQLHLMFLDQVPAIGLYSQPIYVVLSPRMKGFEAWPGGHPRLWGVSLSE